MGQDRCDIRTEVIAFYEPDVLAVVETWLKEEDAILVGGYKWIGNNRMKLNRGAVRGSGGVGF